MTSEASATYSVAARLCWLPVILEPPRHSLPIAIAGSLAGLLAALTVLRPLPPWPSALAGFLGGYWAFSLSCRQTGEYPMTDPFPVEPPLTPSFRFRWFTIIFLVAGASSSATFRGRGRRSRTSSAQSRSGGIALEAEQKLGAKFDQRKFHDAILALGSVPLSVEERMAKFIADGSENPPRAAKSRSDER